MDSTLSGPIFILGRQHSGNTVLAAIFSGVPECLAQLDENSFFEHRGLIDGHADASERAQRVFALMKLECESVRQQTQQHLLRLADDSPGVSALDLYVRGMAFAARAAGRSFWVQKATSYIFYADEILRSIPESRIIYLVRNPYDIVASRKRRHRNRERIWSTMVGWEKGLRIACELQEKFPERVRVLRYEDLVTKPEPAVRALMAWVGARFERFYLDVPHVNRSETVYSLEGDGIGLNSSRVNYYLRVLSHAEIAALDLISNRTLLQSIYPELPHRSRRRSPGAILSGAALLAGGPGWYALDYVRRLWHQPRLLVARTARRLR